MVPRLFPDDDRRGDGAMTLLWFTCWLVAGTPRPEMFGTSWDAWGIALAASVVFDSGWARDWWNQGRRAITSDGRLQRVMRFLQHFGEMGVAMVLGMFAMGMVAARLGSPDTRWLSMSLFMAAPMVAWMKVRGHGWERCAEMAATMIVPALLVVGLNVFGVLSVPEMRSVGHDLMWLSMLGLMLWRWRDYSLHVHGAASLQAPRAEPTGHPLAGAL